MALTKAQLVDLNANELIIDLDADTSITADTDDQIDIKIAGADDFTFTANAFNVLTGSNATFADSAQAKFGTGNDMLVYHDGSNSYVTNATGALKIATETSGIAITLGHSTSEVTVADNLTVSGNLSISGTLTFADGSLAIADLDIDGATDIGANLADADLLVVDDGAGGTNRKTAMSRVKTYIADVTLTTAAQTNITSLGTLSALTVDDVAIDGKVITMTGSSSDTAVITAGTNGTLSIVTTDDSAAAANITITADGTFEADGTTITLDSSGDIVLDADGADVIFKDGGTSILSFTNSSSDAVITASVQDKDIVFKGDDNGSAITALTLDMSEAGAATFNNKIVATELDISGDVDVDGTLEADAITVNGATLTETITDTVGGMVSSNTETGISVTFEDGDNTLDFALAAAQTTITSILATDLKIGEDDQTKIDFETANEIHFYTDNAEQVYVADGILGPQTDNDVDLGASGVEYKDLYIDGVAYLDAIGFGTTAMTLPSADGSANQILVTDGSGTLSFADNSGISMGKAIAAAIVFG